MWLGFLLRTPPRAASQGHCPNGAQTQRTNSRKSKLEEYIKIKRSAGGAASANATHPEVVTSTATVPAHRIVKKLKL